jgi:hypothetical protein
LGVVEQSELFPFPVLFEGEVGMTVVGPSLVMGTVVDGAVVGVEVLTPKIKTLKNFYSISK